MKTPGLFPLLTLLAGILFVAHPLGLSAEPAPAAAPEPTRPITVECRMFTLPAKAAITLIPLLSDETKIAAALTQLEAMVTRDEAKLAAALLCQATLDQKAEAGSTEEFKYGTDFDPPQLPGENATAEQIAKWPHVGVVPTAFTTRDVGPRFEIEAIATTNPAILNCNYQVEHVRFDHMNKIDAGRFANGERLFVEQPVFTTMKNTASCPLTNGQPKLVGVHRLPGAEAVFELFILTVRFRP